MTNQAVGLSGARYFRQKDVLPAGLFYLETLRQLELNNGNFSSLLIAAFHKQKLMSKLFSAETFFLQFFLHT